MTPHPHIPVERRLASGDVRNRQDGRCGQRRAPRLLRWGVTRDSTPAPPRSLPRRLLRGAVLALAVIVVIAVIAGAVAHDPRPAANPSPEADAMAQRMVAAVGGEAWEQAGAAAWGVFGHEYVWDRERGYVEFRDGARRVLLRTGDQSGLAYRDDARLGGEEAADELSRAWRFFCNDSFWFNPVVKAFDPGPTRSIVTVDGEEGLLVSYGEGGVTPGDAYLWLLGPDGRPRAWRMWVSILPVGGVRTSWEGWQELDGGVWIATRHGGGPLGFEIERPRVGPNASSVAADGEDPFSALE